MGTALLLSCEHAGNKLPSAFRSLFDPELLQSHRGLDIGVREFALALSEALEVPLIMTETSRLLIDCNRSLDSPDLFSSAVKSLSEEEKAKIVSEYYQPYRVRVREGLQQLRKNSALVVHLSLHTFTPVLDGIQRNTDIGLLFDPDRKREASLCAIWRQLLGDADSSLRIKDNYPYAGTDDGFTSELRSVLGNEYLGVELEICNTWAEKDDHQKQVLVSNLATSLQGAIARLEA